MFIDDSGDAGMKPGVGSSSHLVMAACVFREPTEIEKLKRCMEECAAKNRHRVEFKYSKTKESLKDCFFDCTSSVDYSVRVIMIEKANLYSAKLRESGSALKSYAIRQLLTKSYGQVRDAKVVIDGQDIKGFNIPDSQYLLKMVNRESPGTLSSVKFGDSKQNVGIQLADMCAGAIHRGIRTHKEADPTHLLRIRHRANQPQGNFWKFC